MSRLVSRPRQQTTLFFTKPRLYVNKCGRQRDKRLVVYCTKEETRRHFYQRLDRQGWLRESFDLRHPLVMETWKAMDEVYGLGVAETPLRPSPWLHSFAGSVSSGSVHLKLENMQVSGSFKARGAAHKLLSLTPEQVNAGAYTSSTGNHGLAVLHMAKALQAAGKPIDVTVYIPGTVTPRKLAKLSAASQGGAQIKIMGEDCVEAEVAARTAAQADGKTYISPYNDLQIAGGQGTIAVEILMSLPADRIDAVFVPVGGGGLASGIAAFLKSVKTSHKDIKVYGCQPEQSDVMRRSVRIGHVIELEWRETLSDATAGGIEESSITLDICSKFVDEWITVSEDQIAAAMVGVHGHHGIIVEGAAGVAVASYMKEAEKMRGKHVVIVICGGNVSEETLDKAYNITNS